MHMQILAHCDEYIYKTKATVLKCCGCKRQHRTTCHPHFHTIIYLLKSNDAIKLTSQIWPKDDSFV